MTELKTGIEISRYDSSTYINKSKLPVKTPKESEKKSATINRKDTETIVVNVIPEKNKKLSIFEFPRRSSLAILGFILVPFHFFCSTVYILCIMASKNPGKTNY